MKFLPGFAESHHTSLKGIQFYFNEDEKKICDM
jgi:hypothetical protein